MSERTNRKDRANSRIEIDWQRSCPFVYMPTCISIYMHVSLELVDVVGPGWPRCDVFVKCRVSERSIDRKIVAGKIQLSHS